MERLQGWTGRKDRYPVEIDGVAHRIDGSSVAVKLSNFSDQGCRLETGDDFNVGERLQIDVPRMGAVKAQVRWSLPGAAGTRFLTDSDF